MKVKTDILDTYNKSFQKYKEIRNLILLNETQKLSEEIKEFYKKNEELIKKYKRKFDKQKNGEVSWCSDLERMEGIDLDIYPDPIEVPKLTPYINIGFDIALDANTSNHLVAEFFIHSEGDSEIIYACSFERGLQKKDLEVVSSLLFRFVYLGGDLNKLRMEYI